MARRVEYTYPLTTSILAYLDDRSYPYWGVATTSNRWVDHRGWRCWIEWQCVSALRANGGGWEVVGKRKRSICDSKSTKENRLVAKTPRLVEWQAVEINDLTIISVPPTKTTHYPPPPRIIVRSSSPDALLSEDNDDQVRLCPFFILCIYSSTGQFLRHMAS